MPKMTITSKAVVPPTEHAHREEGVDIDAQVDCTLWFDDGFAIGLKKNGSCSLAFEDDGYHQFEVEYAKAEVDVEEKVSVTQTGIGGTSVVTESAVMMARVVSGPTGNIVVP